MEINNNSFELKLAQQHWAYEDDSYDLTSHGRVILKINGHDIAGEGDLGINQSAVALLQTVFIDHNPIVGNGFAVKPLFFHGCCEYCTCPNRMIDFGVTHIPDQSVLLNCFYVSGHEIDDPKKHYGASVTITNKEYAKQILEFAEGALNFLPKDKKAGEGDEWQVDIYHAWRNELKDLINMTRIYLRKGNVSSKMHKRAGEFDLEDGGIIKKRGGKIF